MPLATEPPIMDIIVANAKLLYGTHQDYDVVVGFEQGNSKNTAYLVAYERTGGKRVRVVKMADWGSNASAGYGGYTIDALYHALNRDVARLLGKKRSREEVIWWMRRSG
jgi:hypothetical protein